MFEQVTGLLAEHEQLQEELADPALHADAARAKRVNRRYAELSKIKAAHEHTGSSSVTTSKPRANSRVRTRRSPRRFPSSRRRSPTRRRRCVDCSFREILTTHAT